MATDYASLLPRGVADAVIESAAQSVVLRLARTVSMAEGVQSIPVVSAVPQAEWVALGARATTADTDKADTDKSAGTPRRPR